MKKIRCRNGGGEGSRKPMNGAEISVRRSRQLEEQEKHMKTGKQGKKLDKAERGVDKRKEETGTNGAGRKEPGNGKHSGNFGRNGTNEPERLTGTESGDEFEDLTKIEDGVNRDVFGEPTDIGDIEEIEDMVDTEELEIFDEDEDIDVDEDIDELEELEEIDIDKNPDSTIEPEDSDSRPGRKSRKKRKEKEDWEEEQEPAKLWQTMLVFLGLMAAAALICAVLWSTSHADKPEEGGNIPGQSSAPNAPEQNTGTSGDRAEAGEQDGDSQETESGPGEGDRDEPVTEPISGTREMEFTAVEQSVTPKDVVNLRSVPTTADTENIVTQVQNGEVLARTGINEDTGWSEVEYEGRTLYAVSQYLTLDLDYKPSIEASNPNRVSTIDGRIIIFADCDDWVTPKEYVNLRTEPSTSEGNETVSCQLNYGEKAHRTGFSPDSGWSRVEYNGQVLYVVTSLTTVTEE